MYNNLLVNRMRETLISQENLCEKKMFQGLCFMVNDKMCLCVRDNDLICRIDPEKVEMELENGNCRQMIHNGKAMKGYIFVDENGYRSSKNFERLISLCLEFNKIAKPSKKKKN